MGASVIIGDGPVPRRRGPPLELVERALAEQAAARAKIPRRSSFEMIEAILEELNRQLHPLLTSSQARDLSGDELDRMLRISSGTIAIHRQLMGDEPDPTKMTDADLRKAAKGKKGGR